MTDAVEDVEFSEQASAPALQRLWELRMFEGTSELAEKVLKHCVTRWNEIGPKQARELLSVEDGRFILRFDTDSSVKLARWVADDVFLVKQVWTEDWYDTHSAGDIQYQLKGSDSVGHYLSHLVCSHQEKMVLLRENHFDEDLPPKEEIDEVRGDIDLDELYATAAEREEVATNV